MRWPAAVSFPYNAGLVATARLPIRHYPHRDPDQLERRCRLRAVMMGEATNRANWRRPDAHHWSTGHWRSFVKADDAEGLRHWPPGTPLEEVRQANHLASAPKRAAQRVFYALGLPRALDRARKGWTAAARPLPIDPRTQTALRCQLERRRPSAAAPAAFDDRLRQLTCGGTRPHQPRE
jgi:hypothetical protein